MVKSDGRTLTAAVIKCERMTAARWVYLLAILAVMTGMSLCASGLTARSAAVSGDRADGMASMAVLGDDSCAAVMV